MGKPTGFKEYQRRGIPRRAKDQRVQDFQEFYLEWPAEEARTQGARCMNCALPFCHNGCPLHNLIPEWNDLVYRDQWKEALASLHSTNNFPEFTGRICPAPCEASCTLNVNDDPVTIEYIEKSIADRGWAEGWIEPHPPERRTGKKVAVVGSGPAGLAAAQQLNHAGHRVTVFERSEVIGGLLSLGIPGFKLEKQVVQRRVDQMVEEGVEFITGAYVGKDVPTEVLRREYDAILLAIGSTVGRDLDIPGRDLDGIHLAMEYLPQQNRRDAGASIPEEEIITAKGKKVIILGGGDTGSDCLGTALRQGASRVEQIELLPQPPETRSQDDLWPDWPVILRSSHAHEEGGDREWSVLTKSFSGRGGRVERLHAVRLESGPPDDAGRPAMKEVPGSEFDVEADLVLLALGFVHPEREGVVSDLGVELDGRGNIRTDSDRMSSVSGVFASGDAHRGQSLVVWAIAEGRHAAQGIDRYLMGSTELPRVMRAGAV